MTYPGGLTSAGFQAETTADVQASIERDELALMDPALNLSPTQPLGQLNGIFASAGANVWGLLAAIYAAIDPNGAVGVQLDNLCALTGVTRLSATATLVSCTCVFTAGQTYAAGQLVANIAGYPQYTFTNAAAIPTTAGGAQTVVFQATQTGPIQALAGTLSVITTAVGGWTSITNSASGTIGTNIETDTALRLRRASLLVAAGGCTIDSIRSSLLLVQGVQFASVLENNTDLTDAQGNPPHSFQALVWDGATLNAANSALAQAIWNSKPSGIRSFGATTWPTTDATGKTQYVSFTRVTALSIYVAVTVVTNSTYPTNGNALVAAAVQSAFANMAPGSTVYKQAVEAAVFSVQGVVNVSDFRIDTVPSPVATTDITATAYQLPTFVSCTVSPT